VVSLGVVSCQLSVVRTNDRRLPPPLITGSLSGVGGQLYGPRPGESYFGMLGSLRGGRHTEHACYGEGETRTLSAEMRTAGGLCLRRGMDSEEFEASGDGWATPPYPRFAREANHYTCLELRLPI